MSPPSSAAVRPALFHSTVLRLCLPLLVSLLLSCGLIRAAERVALVIGNTIYDPSKNHDPSKGPVAAPNLVTAGNDAEAMAALLRNKLGFEVILRKDVKLDQFAEAVLEFRQKAAGASMCLVYFAGHGVESATLGDNFLLPVGAGLEKEAHLETQTYPLKRLLGAVQSLPARTRLVVLDCCRNNPLEGRSWYSQKNGRGSGGLGAVDSGSLDQTTMVVFSAAPGKPAKDRLSDTDRHSPFASVLLETLVESGKSCAQVFGEVEEKVFERTGEEQRPKTFLNGNLAPFTRFVFLPGGPDPAPPPPVPLLTGPAAATREKPYVNSLGMEFIPVPGKRGLLMCRTETRVRDFRAYARDTEYEQTGGVYVMKVKTADGGGPTTAWELDRNASWEEPGFEQTEDHPVVGISWEEARAFCEWLSKRERFTVRLASDAEWSAAVGAGKYPWGAQWPPPEGAGNYWGTEATRDLPGKGWPVAYQRDDGSARTAAVGSFPESRLGFFDLGGNVWEWCQDEYRRTMNTAEARKAIPALEKEKSDDGTPYRVVRGGSWSNS